MVNLRAGQFKGYLSVFLAPGILSSFKATSETSNITPPALSKPGGHLWMVFLLPPLRQNVQGHNLRWSISCA